MCDRIHRLQIRFQFFYSRLLGPHDTLCLGVLEVWEEEGLVGGREGGPRGQGLFDAGDAQRGDKAKEVLANDAGVLHREMSREK